MRRASTMIGRWLVRPNRGRKMTSPAPGSSRKRQIRTVGNALPLRPVTARTPLPALGIGNADAQRVGYVRLLLAQKARKAGDCIKPGAGWRAISRSPCAA